ncbi:hypothetical protein L798_08636 [Zootermopsis nevadensis]|uniref:Uncharacterized protein n=1 Tax=Zootermopsis nevadensis TaxID=136037 RepID=A0A067R442_ZOONE|nr:hypothetical protein L798_08636 [Zootermopsis nevadensis]
MDQLVHSNLHCNHLFTGKKMRSTVQTPLTLSLFFVCSPETAVSSHLLAGSPSTQPVSNFQHTLDQSIYSFLLQKNIGELLIPLQILVSSQCSVSSIFVMYVNHR